MQKSNPESTSSLPLECHERQDQELGDTLDTNDLFMNVTGLIVLRVMGSPQMKNPRTVTRTLKFMVQMTSEYAKSYV